MTERNGATDVGWAIVHSRAALDPARYLGELSDLPLRGGNLGEWCDVVIHDSHGEMRWTFLVVKGRSLSVPDEWGKTGRRRLSPPRANGRYAAVRPLREWEREDEAAAASSAPTCVRAAAGTDGKGSSRRLHLVDSAAFT